MKDCGCEKGKETENWPSEKEVGDDFLFEEGTDMIKSIKKNLKYVKLNTEAIFNRKMDEDQLSALVLDDTVIDYSYLDGDDETFIDYEVNQTPMMEEDDSGEETEVESVTSEVASEVESVTSEVASEVESVTSEVESVTSEVASEVESVTSEVEPEIFQMDDFKIIDEKEEPLEADTEYQEKLKYSSKTDAEKYLNDLL